MPIAQSVLPHRQLLVVLFVVVAIASGLQPFRAHLVRAADGPTITTVAGSVGEGPALTVGQYPMNVTLHGEELFIADGANSVIRAINLSSGWERVVAGNGGIAGPADIEEGVAARATTLAEPQDVAFDTVGNMYIADSASNRVRKVTPNGIITTVAGRGDQASDGDGGPATAAGIYAPSAVVIDPAGNLYIADVHHNRIRRVSPAGTITTFVGTGVAGEGGDGGPATDAQLRSPTGLLVAAGALLIADTGNSRIRRVSLTTGVISTIAGTGTAGWSGDGGPATAAQLNAPGGLAVHPAGGYVIADTLNHRVRRINADGTISTIAGNGVRHYGRDGIAATETHLFAPEGVAVRADGTIFIADTRASRVRAIDTAGVIWAAAGTYHQHWNGDSNGLSTQLSFVQGTALAPNGDLYFADGDSHLIRRLRASDNAVVRVAGDGIPGIDGDGGLAAHAQVWQPMRMTVAPDGDLLFADNAAQVVRRIDAESGIISRVAGTGVMGYAGDGGAATKAELAMPWDVAVEADGDVLIADFSNNRIRRVDAATGIISTIAGTGEGTEPSGDGGRAVEATLGNPAGLAVGGDGSIFVSQLGYGRVRRIRLDGTITTYAGGGVPGAAGDNGDGGRATAATLSNPMGIDVDANGALFIAESSAIRRVSPDGWIHTVAGGSRQGFSGDNGPPTVARLSRPADVTVTPAGDTIYLADTYNLRIRRADVTTPPVGLATTSTTARPPGTPTTTTASPHPSAARSGYWMVARNGATYAFGDAPDLGDVYVGNRPARDLAATPSGRGFWVIDDGGHVMTKGDAAFYGHLTGLAPGEETTSISPTPSGAGYWIFTNHGRVAAFGSAVHHGDMSATTLNEPVLDSVATPDGKGYYMVASDGGVFSFGTARFKGSMANTRLNGPVRSLVPDGDGDGYWLVASDGGIFAFNARFLGSMGGTRLNQPITGMVGFGTAGYMMVASDGGVFSFGTAEYRGSLGGSPPIQPVVSIAAVRS